jgi:hypothetical protein
VAKKSKHKNHPAKPAVGVARAPSAATLFRMKNLDLQTRELIERSLSGLDPIGILVDRKLVQRIAAVSTPDELLDLANIGSGIAEKAWLNRADSFGSEIVPRLADRLRSAQRIKDPDERDITIELLIQALRWRGQAGSGALLDSFDELSDYGKNLASTALGLIGPVERRSEAAGKIWDFHEKVKRDRSGRNFVGALWGLVDFREPGAALALQEHLERRHIFYELFGFLSLVGDENSVLPLLALGLDSPDDRDDALMAVAAIGHRIGREGLAQILAGAAPSGESPEEIEKLAEGMLRVAVHDIQEFFALFYRGITPEDLTDLLNNR